MPLPKQAPLTPPIQDDMPPAGDEQMPPVDASMGEPDMSQEQGNTDMFGKEKFDAGIDVDENEDPKKYIEKLTGKLAQKLRDYNGTETDNELNKFVINSLIPASVPQMDEDDAGDVIKKVKDNIGKGAIESPVDTQPEQGDESLDGLGAENQEPQAGDENQQKSESLNDMDIDDLISEIFGGKSVKRNIKNKNPFKAPKFK